MHEGLIDRGFRSHAAVRWADAIAGALASPSDPKTLGAWSRAVGASPSSLRAWCRAAGESCHATLDLVRVIRGMALAEVIGWNPWNLFDIVDERTMRAFHQRCGLCRPDVAPRVPEFIATTRLIKHDANRDALLLRLRPSDENDLPLHRFLLEAVVAPRILSGIAARGLTAVLDGQTEVTAGTIVLAFGIAAFVGVTFGYYPARRASRLDPIDSLRYE